MSDILLKKFNKTNYKYKDPLNINNNFLTPNKKLRYITDATAQNLSPHGIYLSPNNTLLISKKNNFFPSSLTIKINFNNEDTHNLSIDKNLITETKNIKEEKKFSITSNYHKDKNIFNFIEPKLKTCFSYKKKKKLNKTNDIKKLEKLNDNKNLKLNKKMLIISKNKEPDKNNNNIKSRNLFNEFTSFQNYNVKYPTLTIKNYHSTTSIFRNNSNKENKRCFKTIKKDKNLFYKITKKDKIDNKKEAEKIINELLSLKTKKDIKSYYFKKDYAKAIAEAEKDEKNKNINKVQNSIDPMTYIKFNLKNYPKNNDLFKSLDTQIMVLGNQKYRNELLDGVNVYKKTCFQYEDLRGPIGFDKDKINEKKRNEILKKMKMNYVGEKGLLFSNRLYKKKYHNKFDFEFDENYKEVKKFLYKNFENYETNMKFNKGEKLGINVNINDINTLKKIDKYAEFIVHDKNEMIKFSHKFLSLDEKIDKILTKTKDTTSYLFKRAKEHHKIKKKIDDIYEI